MNEPFVLDLFLLFSFLFPPPSLNEERIELIWVRVSFKGTFGKEKDEKIIRRRRRRREVCYQIGTRWCYRLLG